MHVEERRKGPEVGNNKRLGKADKDCPDRKPVALEVGPIPYRKAVAYTEMMIRDCEFFVCCVKVEMFH